MTDLICVKELFESRGIPTHCFGRKETIACVKCREQRENAAAIEYYSKIEPLEAAHCEPFPDKENK